MREVTVSYDPQHEDWVVKIDGRADSTYELKHDAEREGREMAKTVRPSQLKIFNMKDRISYMQVYD